MTTNDTDVNFASAPLPTAKTQRGKNLLIQFQRFIAMNTKMVKIIREEHR
jgi:hypothetical protein